MLDDILDLLGVIERLTGDAGRVGEIVVEQAKASYGKIINTISAMDVSEIPDNVKEAVLRRV